LHRLLILYDYFDPAFKAGGPIRSLVNLVRLMDQELEIFVLTTNQDHDGEVLDIQADQWMPYGEKAKVMYLAAGSRGYKNIQNAIDHVRPDTVYFNGMYSIPLLVFPLQILKKRKEVKAVIAPRGMLQRESLSIKPWKKQIFLTFLKWFYLNKEIQWHVTTEQEKADLLHFWHDEAKIDLVGNIPSFDPDYNPRITPVKPNKAFGTVALISPMKNIHLVLSTLKEIQQDVVYHLYGPVKDEAYWSLCKEIIKTLSPNISVIYHGEIIPGEVSETIAAFDFYIQPSKSENFGHSIFEAFNQGVPVIISDQTPWKRLKEKQAGWDVDLKHPEALIKAIEEAIHLDDVSYLALRKGARKVAEQYMEANDFGADYLKLFSR
jgi:glycosyltransferase involved in cell wall biosynthesis